MNPECEAAIEDVLGRSLTKGEAKKVEDAVNLHARLLAGKDRAAWMAMPQFDRLQAAAKAAGEEMVSDLQAKQQRVRLQIAAHDRLDNALNEAFQNLPPEKEHWWQFGRTAPGSRMRAVSRMLAFDASGSSGMQSAESLANSVQNAAIGRLLPLWSAVKGIAGVFDNPKGVSDLLHELFGEDTGNAAAKGAAVAWRTVTEELRVRANAAGMQIGKLDQWHYPQSHSQARVAQAGLERWTQKILPLLDRDKYLNEDGTRQSDAQVGDFLAHAFDTIITDGQSKVQAGQLRGYGMGLDSPHRSIFFKNADAYLSYQGEFGDRSLYPILTGHIRAISRDIGVHEVMGPQAEQTFRYFNDRTLRDELLMYPGSAPKIRTASAYNEALFDYVAGRRAVVNQTVADAFQAFRNFETAAKLGRVVITALGDEAGMAATAFANKVPWSDVLTRELLYLNPANAADRRIAAESGLGVNSIIGSLNRFGFEDLQLGGSSAVRDFTSKLATGVLHASGAEAMWDTRRKALGSVLMSYLGRVTRDVAHFSDINQADHGMLATKGITENDWQVWKLAQTEDWGTAAHTVLTPKAVSAIPDAQLAALGDPAALKRHAASMLLGHVLEETGMGVMDTGARQRAGMFLGTQAGSVGGELLRSTLLFKSFAFSMMMKHWARAASMPTAAGSAAYMATLFTTGTIVAAIANQLRDLASGKDPENIAEPKFWGAAILRGGGLGFYGDFLYAEMNQHDTTLIPALMGPLATEAESVWNLTGGAAFKASRGERTDEAGNLIRFAKSDVPVLNMWYTQAAADHLIWNDMQEAASPGYLERVQARAYEQRGTTWYWKPGESLPESGPDFSKLYQPERGRQQVAKLGELTGLRSESD